MKKLISLLSVLLLTLVSFTTNAEEYPRGDVDQDGSVNIADVTCLIDNLLKGILEGDVDQDGTINISDVTCLIDYLLRGSWPDEPVTPPDNHEWVDLGLPSGTLWATMNVGASCPEDYGTYFSWGETAPKSYYDGTTYKWYRYSEIEGHFMLTKYCTDSNYGVFDNKTELEPEDDAAYVNWGPSWRMPTREQCQELIDNCTRLNMELNGVKGELITGSNGASIFLPFAGRLRFDDWVQGVESAYSFWSRTLHSSQPGFADCLSYYPSYLYVDYWGRTFGITVRAVRVSHN